MSNGFQRIDPYGGGQEIDPYGGNDPDHPDPLQAGETVDQIEEQAPQTWRTWRTKGAFQNWKTLPRALPYLRPYRRLYVAAILFTILISIISLAEPWPFAIVIDSVIGDTNPAFFLTGIFGEHGSYSPYALLVFVVALGFFIQVGGHGLQVLNDYVSAKLEQNMILDLRSKLFAHCERLSLSFHDERYTGQLMSVINLQASSIGEVLMAFPPIVQNLLTLVGMLTISMLIDWQVTLISLVAVPLIYYATGLYGTRIVPRIRQVMSLEWRSLSIVFEAMSMLRVIVSFGREKYEWRRFRDQGRTAVDARVGLTVRQTMFSLGVTAATALGTCLVLGFGAWHVLNKTLTLGELYVLMAYIAQIYQPLEMIGTTVGNLHQNFVFMNAALSILDQEPEVKEDPNAKDLGRAQGALKMENVSFSYKSRVDTLKNITFECKPGERVAVVGPTGAGKTTLVNLIVRFYDPKEGTISIDGVDLRKVKLDSLRENVSLVLQQPMLFSGTIAENIRYGKLDATMEDIFHASRSANSHEFIEALPDGYQTNLGEGGAQLSGGERQRICVARAFVKDAPILILDEPTSSIDSKTEAVILDALDELMAGRTSFMIAHRLSTIHDADRILVINHGDLVEQGTHDQLIAQGGLYSQLYEAQTRHKAKRRVEAAREAAREAVEAAHELESLPTNGGGEEVAEDVKERLREALEDGTAVPPPAPAGADAAPPAEPAPANGEPEVEAPDGHEHGQHRRPIPAPNRARVDSGRRRRGVVKIASLRQDVHCDVCGRALLKGELAEPFLAPKPKRKASLHSAASTPGPFLTNFRASNLADGERRLVCEVCWPVAEEYGWLAVQSGPGSS